MEGLERIVLAHPFFAGFEKELGVSLGNVGEVFDKGREAITGKGPASMILKTSIKYWPGSKR